MNQNTLIGILIPFAGTALGSAMVFFMKKEMNERLQKLLLGFASGVMMAASVWSLLIPAIDMTEQKGGIPWFPPAAGFLLGMGFLLVLDTLTPHLHFTDEKPEGAMTLAGAFALSVGIAIQNFPEGAIISMPLKSQGLSKTRAFIYGALSGIVEPAAAFLTILLTGFVVPLLPYLLAFAAGAMIYVVVEELIPEAQTGAHSNISTVGVAAGFVLMMILDVALG